MENQRIDKLQAILQQFKDTVGEKPAVKLELDKCGRVIQRLDSYSSDCKDCEQYLTQLEQQIIQLTDTSAPLTEHDFKHHKEILHPIISHLQQQHKLVTAGYFLGIYMSLGMSLGVVFGLLVFDNIALGLPIGMCIGIAIGSGLDADAKKKGLTL